ncbi:MAG: TIM barrel protein [Cyclobacteriaceae bacterium]
MNFPTSRRDFLKQATLGATALSLGSLPSFAAPLFKPGDRMKLGLVTYLWGKDWNLPTLISNCEQTGLGAVELRIEHAHGVGLELTKQQRAEVKNRFEDSPVMALGMGTNEQYDYPEQERLKKAIADTKAYLHLSQDIGGTGIKVKPNQFHEGVPHEKTLEQIGRSLNEVGKYGADLGQQIRLEVHGNGTQELPNIKKIMEVADHPNVTVCWNCNQEDLIGQGLVHNFNLVKDRFGDTVHVREMNMGDYPYQELMNLLVKMNYGGWILLECRTNPEDRLQAIREQDKVWKQMIRKAQKV